jgi:hypothetical protein
MDKKIHIRINRDSPEMTLQEVMDKMKQLQEKHPDRDFFFDGDEYAICSRSKEK